MTGLAEQLLAALPQTQCTRCGYPDCAAYAQSVVCGVAAINQCPPGGEEGIAKLAALTGQPIQPLNPDNGVEAPRSMMFIDEAWCIGCTLCIKACPVDAIFGSNKLMHTILDTYCTGCALCLPVCPVDCILVENVSGNATGWAAWSQAAADQARDRYGFHIYRVKGDQGENDPRVEEKVQMKPDGVAHHLQPTDAVVVDKKRAVIEAALARARAKREGNAANSDSRQP